MSSVPKHPFISAQLSTRVTQLDFQGDYSAVESVRSFISTFKRVSTVRCYGQAAETVMRALYELQISRVQNHGEETLGCIGETTHSLPKELKAVIIRDYEGERREIYPLLQQIRQDAAADTYPVRIIFYNCLNIPPSIRRELAVPRLFRVGLRT